MKILFLLFLFFTSSIIFAQAIEKGKSYYVFTESGTLNLRQAPEKGQVIQKLERGTQVKVTKTNHEDSNLPYGWVEVSIGKTKGFLSTQFLSSIHPKDINKAHMIASLKPTDVLGVNHIQPIAFHINQIWLGVAVDQIESAAFLKLALNNKYNFSILNKTGKIVESKNIFEVGKFGCQEYKGGKIRSNLDSSKEEYLVVYGFKPQTIELNDKVSDSLLKQIRQNAIQEFVKNNISQEETKDLLEKHYLANANNNQFVLSRFATKKGDFEHGNLFLIYTLNKNKVNKKVFSNFKELGEEVAPYGGSFHLKGGFIKDEKLIFIMYSNGFDGYLQEIYELSPKEFKQVASGGGDAC